MKYIATLLLVSCVLCTVSCRSRISAGPNDSNISNTPQLQDSTIPTSKASRINVYLENSGSMNGYINSNSDFKTAIADLLVLLDYNYSPDSVFMYFINSDIYPVRRSNPSTTFIKQLSAANFRVGDVGSTDLNDIFRILLSKTDSKTISILLSDCIYSIKGAATSHLLGMAKAETKGTFLQKSKLSDVGYTTTIVKLLSDFDGVYYDKDNKAHIYNGKRPYYMCVIGSSDIMSDFNAKVPLKSNTLQGFQNSFTLSTQSNDNIPFWSVLSATECSARFNPMKGEISSKYIRGIEDIELNNRTNDLFSFCMAVDMSKYQVDEGYITSPQNYVVTKGDFSIVSITPIDQVSIKSVDKKYIGQASHIICLQANGNAYSDIQIQFKNTIPNWVNQTNSEDDTKAVDDSTTFGIGYMVGGIAEAYAQQNKDSNFYTIDIPISKSSSMSLLGILSIILSLGAVGLVVVLIYKRNKK